MKKLKLIRIAQLVLVALFFVLLSCIVISIAFTEFSDRYWSVGAVFSVLIIYLFLELRVAYLLENMSKEEQHDIKNDLYQSSQIDAFDYVINEHGGHKTRFERRYGGDIYDLFVKKGIIKDYPLENKWHMTNYANKLHLNGEFIPYSLE